MSLTSSVIRRPKRSIFIQTPAVVLVAFFSVFFSRLVDTLGAPSIVNFIHFATVPLACFVALNGVKFKRRQDRDNIQLLVLMILMFLIFIIISTLFNDAGTINAVLAFLLWAEPYLFLIAILCLPTTPVIVEKLRKWITRAFFFHTLLAFVQQYGLKFYLNSGAQDNIQGVFYRSGAGHVVGASVALVFAIYYLTTAVKVPVGFRLIVLMAAFWHMILADAKQVLLSIIVGGAILLLINLKDVAKTIRYITIAIIMSSVLYWCVENLDAFSAFKTWIRPEIYGPDGEATLLKFAAFRVIPNFYRFSLHWLIGLGPGHSVDRLGGWMLVEYQSLLGPLGSSTHPASFTVWKVVAASWLGDQSSMFSPLFGWVALWGDFGVFGLFSYMALVCFVYLRICTSDISKLIVLNIFAVGFIFSQLQEPAYMLSMVMLIGLNWHENKLRAIYASEEQFV